jgi:hypothetical protein
MWNPVVGKRLESERIPKGMWKGKGKGKEG